MFILKNNPRIYFYIHCILLLHTLYIHYMYGKEYKTVGYD